MDPVIKTQASPQENAISLPYVRDFKTVMSRIPQNFWFGSATQNPYFAGAIAGFSEATAAFWTVTWKNCRQQNIPLPNSIRGFYKGFTLNAVCMMLFFSVMNGVNQWVKKEQKQIRALTGESMLAKFAPAIFGGVAASIFLNPIEVTTIQRGKNKDKNLSITMKKIYQEFGWKGFYKGFCWALARNIPYSLGINLIGPQTKEWIKSYFKSDDYAASVGSTIAGVGIAGFSAGLSTQVIDNVKTQIQAGNFPGGGSALKTLYKQGGIRRLFAGLTPRLVRTTGGSVVAVGVLESLARVFQSPKG